MGSGIFFPIAAIPFSFLVTILFFVKGHIESKETKIDLFDNYFKFAKTMLS